MGNPNVHFGPSVAAVTARSLSVPPDRSAGIPRGVLYLAIAGLAILVLALCVAVFYMLRVPVTDSPAVGVFVQYTSPVDLREDHPTVAAATGHSLAHQLKSMLLDSAASKGVCNNRTWFRDFDEEATQAFDVVSSEPIFSQGEGSVDMNMVATCGTSVTLSFGDISYIPGQPHCVLSLTQLFDQGYDVDFRLGLLHYEGYSFRFPRLQGVYPLSEFPHTEDPPGGALEGVAAAVELPVFQEEYAAPAVLDFSDAEEEYVPPSELYSAPVYSYPADASSFSYPARTFLVRFLSSLHCLQMPPVLCLVLTLSLLPLSLYRGTLKTGSFSGQSWRSIGGSLQIRILLTGGSFSDRRAMRCARRAGTASLVRLVLLVSLGLGSPSTATRCTRMHSSIVPC